MAPVISTMCEKCWADAWLCMMTRGGSQSEHYYQLLKERLVNPCSLEEQTGIPPEAPT